jgi:hypothetical protein
LVIYNCGQEPLDPSSGDQNICKFTRQKKIKKQIVLLNSKPGIQHWPQVDPRYLLELSPEIAQDGPQDGM